MVKVFYDDSNAPTGSTLDESAEEICRTRLTWLRDFLSGMEGDFTALAELRISRITILDGYKESHSGRREFDATPKFMFPIKKGDARWAEEMYVTDLQTLANALQDEAVLEELVRIGVMQFDFEQLPYEDMGQLRIGLHIASGYGSELTYALTDDSPSEIWYFGG